MSTPSMESLVERIEQLERGRRQLVWGLGTILSLALALVASQAHVLGGRGKMEAAQFALKDSSGRTRATLAMGDDGTPALTLLDEKGDPSVRLNGSSEQASALTFLERGHVNMSLNSMAGATSLQMFDQRQRGTLGFYVWPDGTTGFGMKYGKQRIDLATASKGETTFSICDRDGVERHRLDTLHPWEWERRSTAAHTPETSVLSSGAERRMIP